MIDPLTVKYGSSLLDNPLLRQRVADVMYAYQMLADYNTSEHETWVVSKYIELATQTTGYTDVDFVKKCETRLHSDITLNTDLDPSLKISLILLVHGLCQDQISYIKWVKEGVYE